MNIVVYILVVVNYNKIPTNENVCVFAVKTVKERQFLIFTIFFSFCVSRNLKIDFFLNNKHNNNYYNVKTMTFLLLICMHFASLCGWVPELVVTFRG